MKNIDSSMHVKGESVYVDDIPTLAGTLYAAVYGSPIAHGKLNSVDIEQAKKMPGVVDIFTAKDIPGRNQIGSIIEDEELFADKEVHFMGMPIAVVVAETEEYARSALKKISVDIQELKPIIDEREAHKEGLFICPSRTFAKGDVDLEWNKCDHVFEGQSSMGGQEHVYLETHGSYVYPLETGNFKVHAGTQAPWYVQKGVQKVLGIPLSRIEVDVVRIGGGFGGKEDQGTPWACMAALASYHLKRPVKLVLDRSDDMHMSGKRHPYSFDFKIGLTKDLKIKAYEVVAYQNAGASSDVSPAVMERTLFHGGSSYNLDNAKITVHSCRTNLPPNTAFRGFGGPQGMFAIESAIYKAASELGVDVLEIQEKNLLSEENIFPYGQVARKCNAKKSWNQAQKEFDINSLKKEVNDFNKNNTEYKKGISIFPLCFGISFTKTSLNQGRSLVHIYSDGSVGFSTGVIEMGQGVNTKILQVAATTLGISPDRVKVISTNTTRIANASPTAASSGADLNGHATRIACENLKQRLIIQAAKELNADVAMVTINDEVVHVNGQATKLKWEELIFLAYENRVSLSEHAHYSTPNLSFDKKEEKGNPFAYHVYGTAVTVAKIDCIRGSFEIEKIGIVHDFGKSMNLDIDMGQVEGALLQGIGLMTIEELLFNEKGKMVYNNLSSYKVPDIYTIPKELKITPLEEDGENSAIMGSKAVGEPPLMYGIGSYFAVMNAIKAFNQNVKLDLNAPITYQKTLLSLYSKE